MSTPLTCCYLDPDTLAPCGGPAEFEVWWNTGYEDYTHACRTHVGDLIGHPPGEPEPDHYTVRPFAVPATV